MSKLIEADHDEAYVANPFVHSFKIDPSERIKIYLIAAILAPFRIVGLIIFFILTVLLGELCTRNMDFSKPMSGFRLKVLLPIFKVVGRCLFLCGGFNWIRLKGQRASAAEAPIMIAAPHSSFYDALIVIALGMPSVVGKTETANSVIGSLIKMTQPILVDRDDPMSRQNTLQEIRTRSRSNGYWQQILVFPEGTCTNRSCLINFKQGAFSCGVPVQPVTVRWHQKIDSITWTWDGPGIWELVWMTLIQLHTWLEIEYLPVYVPSAEEQADPQLYADNARCVMSKALGLPTTDLSFDDCRRIRSAALFSLPMACYIHEYGKLTRALFSEINLGPVKSSGKSRTTRVTERLTSMAEATRQWHSLGCSSITPGFLESVFFPGGQSSVKDTTLLRRLISTLPKTENGQADLRVLVVHLCMLMFTDPPLEAVRHAFRAFDAVTSDGALRNGDTQISDWPISVDDAVTLLHTAYRMNAQDIMALLKTHSSELSSPSGSPTSVKGDHGEKIASVFPDALFAVMTATSPNLVDMYAKYKADMARIRRRLERPFSDTASSSNSTSSLYNMNKQSSSSSSTFESGDTELPGFRKGHTRDVSNVSVNSTNSLDFEMEIPQQEVRLRGIQENHLPQVIASESA